MGRSLFISFFIGLSILALVGSFVWARMFYASYRFELRDRDILVESGVLFRKRTYIPYSRIQNVNVLQGPIL
ncbi:MAG: PH domain-containing protein, partial [Thermoplasmata archaeon]